MCKFKLFLLLGLLPLLMVACSGGNPISTPSNSVAGFPDSQLSFQDRNLDSVPGALGFYQVKFDGCSTTASLEPVRISDSADVLEAVDITSFMSVLPCRDCVKIYGVGYDEQGYLTLTMGIKHPFPAGDPSKAVSGRNRADLQVFNVEGIVISDSPKVVNFPKVNLKVATGGLVNADGYTAYLDPVLDMMFPTESNIHPYILHFKDYSNGNFSASNPCGFADPLNPSGYLVMKMGSDFDIQQYKFQIEPGKSLDFVLAFGCTYGLTTTSSKDRFTPDYRLPQQNKKAASEVHINVLSNNLERGQQNSAANLEIQVKDINAGVSVGTGKDQMRYQSNIAKITVEAPDLMSNSITMNNPTPLSGDGRTTPFTFQASVKNENNAPYGFYPILVKVLDSYPTNTNTTPGLMGADGIGRVGPTANPLGGIFLINEFATYQVIEVMVLPRTSGNPLRITVPPVDFGIDASGHALIGYSDRQIWRYETDYSIGNHYYDFNYSGFGALKALAVQKDGSSLVVGGGGC